MKIEKKNLGKPDETRSFDKGKIEVLKFDDKTIACATFEPGWRWSTSMKALVGTESCEIAHYGVILSGRIHIRANDGTEQEFGKGDVALVPPGHDAWTLGNEPCVWLELNAGEQYATDAREQPKEEEERPAVH